VCTEVPETRGIDVSSYQGEVDWARVKRGGIAFAFARISDGSGELDNEFAHHWRAMKRAGVVRGAYQFFRAGQDAVAQANLAAELLALAGGMEPSDLGVAIDIETTDGKASEEVSAAVARWLESAERLTGRTPIIYTNAAMSGVLVARFAKYPLWVANWDTGCPTVPSGWSKWRYWQTSNSGRVDGIATPVDLDVLDGNLPADFEGNAFAGVDAGSAAGDASLIAGECEPDP
jgi:lysozyme